MSLQLSYSPGNLVAMSGIDGVIFLSGSNEDDNDVDFTISPSSFCDLIEGFLHNCFPSVSITEPDLIQSACEMGVEIRQGGQTAKLSLDDYVFLVKYFFINTDLRASDPRLIVVNRIVISDACLGNDKSRHQVELFDWLAKLETRPGWNTAFYPKSPAKRLAERS